MPDIPINSSSIKNAFLDGDGTLELITLRDAWKDLIDSNKPFDSKTENLAILKVGTGATKDLQLGRVDGLKLNIDIDSEAAGRISLIWPDGKKELIDAYGLEPFLKPGHFYAALILEGKGDINAAVGFPAGPLSPVFGISSGGNLAFERLHLCEASMPARNVICELLSGINFPQNFDSPEEIPGEGEVYATRFGGYLNLTSKLTWGYSITGTPSFEVGNLQLALDLATRLKAGASFDYRLAGNFCVEARRGAMDGWLRLIVHKDRDSVFKFATDFGYTGKADLNGLPGTADQFLTVLFGTDAGTILGLFNRAKSYSSLDELEYAAGTLTHRVLIDISEKWIDKALTNETLVEFLEAAKIMAEAYAAIDKRIIDLYEDYLDRLPALQAALNLLCGASSREDLKLITDIEAWVLIRRIWNDAYHELLREDEEFAKFSRFINQVREFIYGGAAKQLRDFIALVKKEFPLDRLVEDLAKYAAPDKLRDLTNDKLQALAGTIIGKAFEKLEETEIAEAASRIHSTLVKIVEFKNTWYERMSGAVHKSFEFSLNYAYSRADHRSALLDIEFNATSPRGIELARKAARGDFMSALSLNDPDLVRINRGMLTHGLTRSAQVQVNVFGWGFKNVSTLIQESEHAIEAGAGGLIHVYMIDTHIHQRRERGGKHREAVESNFLMRVIGKTVPDSTSGSQLMTAEKRFLMSTLDKMAIEYDLAHEDDYATAERLIQYLDLAELLGMIPNREQMVKNLAGEMPSGPGKVKINYVVRYDSKSVESAFTLGEEKTSALARQTARQLIAAKYTGMRQIDWLARVGFAYLDPSFYSLYREGYTALLAEGKAVQLPEWFTGGRALNVELEPVHRQLLLTLYNIEEEYVEALVRLEKTIAGVLTSHKSVPVDELEKAAVRFVDMADDLDQYRENTFFAIFDKLVMEGSPSESQRKSAMVLEITTPGGQKVKKFLMG